MKLAEYQRTVIELSFASKPSDDAFLVLGEDAARFRLYRHMIRTRIFEMTKVAFRRTHSHAGEAAFGAAFERYLVSSPPHSPLIREVVGGFGAFAQDDAALIAQGPGYLRDLLCFEATKWRLSFAPCVRPKLGEGGVRTLDFEGVPVWNPLLTELLLKHTVHALEDPPSVPKERTFVLLMYRPDGVDEVRWYAADALFAGIVQRARFSEEPLSTTIRHVTEAQALALDQALLEKLVDAVTLAVQRGVLVGVR